MSGARLALLEKLVAEGKADAFARYALALEYRKASQLERAVATFEALRAAAPEYVPQYLMAAQTLQALERFEEARSWADQGLAVAERAGDEHARSELASFREALGG